MPKLHSVREYRFVAPGDVHHTDIVVKEQVDELAQHIEDVLAGYKAAQPADDRAIAWADGAKRTEERTVCVKRLLV